LQLLREFVVDQSKWLNELTVVHKNQNIKIENLKRINLICSNDIIDTKLFEAIKHNTFLDPVEAISVKYGYIVPDVQNMFFYTGENTYYNPENYNSVCVLKNLGDSIHYSKLEEMWENLFTWSFNQNVQIFATTHSRDCVIAFSDQNTSDQGVQIEVYINQNNEIEFKNRDYNQLKYAIEHCYDFMG